MVSPVWSGREGPHIGKRLQFGVYSSAIRVSSRNPERAQLNTFRRHILRTPMSELMSRRQDPPTDFLDPTFSLVTNLNHLKPRHGSLTDLQMIVGILLQHTVYMKRGTFEHIR